MWAHKQCLADEFLSFYRTLCFWEFVFLLMKHFLLVLCLFFFLSWLNYVPHITARWADFLGLAGWRIFFCRRCKVIGFFLLLQGAFYPVSFLSLLSAPQQSAVFTHFLCCTSAVTRGEHSSPKTWQDRSALLVFASHTGLASTSSWRSWVSMLFFILLEEMYYL